MVAEAAAEEATSAAAVVIAVVAAEQEAAVVVSLMPPIVTALFSSVTMRLACAVFATGDAGSPAAPFTPHNHTRAER